MKKVKFIPLGFYDYDQKIKEEMEQLGYEVNSFTPIGRYSALEKLVNAATKGKYLSQKTYRREMKYMLNDPEKYDIVFVIVGRQLHPEILKRYRRAQKDAKFILYLWDDIDRIENYTECRKYYDEIYSFDLRDVKNHHLKHLPLFYTRYHEYQNEKKRYLFNLSGLLHSERLQIFRSIIDQCGLNKKRCFLYLLGAKISHFIQAALPTGDEWITLKHIHVKGLPMVKMAEIMKRTKVALDVQFGTQAGLTMRTMESIGAQVKLITTNPYVKEYDFYQYGNICLIDRENPRVSRDFFKEPYHPVPDEIASKYSLTNWLRTILED